MKKHLKKGCLATLVALSLTGCQSNGQLKPVSQVKPGVAEQGTLANSKLVADTTAALEKLPQGHNVQVGAIILKFVVQKPVGQPGSRSWREMWIADPQGNAKQFLITFNETGANAADFRIQPMK